MLITKIEAKEACDWLRAAGFPQYAQLFKDCGFPIDVDWAKRDHSFLDKDALDSLCRRLSTLNKCMEMRLEPRRSKRRGNENEEDFCAISPIWTFDRRTRRWRRCGSMVEAPSPADSPGGPGDASLCDHHDICSINSSSSSESEGQSFRENCQQQHLSDSNDQHHRRPRDQQEHLPLLSKQDLRQRTPLAWSDWWIIHRPTGG
ncbi:hypothetical protein fugu_008594 [Takifugu bimaculatus]|uniref:SAM domain-containing protein n=1 Tax=Takifugu bimaculatus TaxID=433685 RepID=A0A4Z2AY65_9TELE|nr:hypothetical protein fugu_008594 [Takifugu bimaculatus]